MNLFFEGIDSGLESILQGPAEELSPVAEQERLAAVNDLAGRGRVGGGLQFPGQGQGPLDDQALQRGHGVEAGGGHGGLLRESDPFPRFYLQTEQIARIRWRTRC